MEEKEKLETVEEQETAENLTELPELLYGEDKKPGKTGIRPADSGEIITGSGSAAVSLTDRDRMTLGRIRDLAAETPEVIGALMRADDTPAMVKDRM